MATAQPKWGGVGYLTPALNILARLYDGVVILGLIAPPGITFNGVRNISKEDLKNLDYDLILVAGQNASLVPILKESETLGIDEDKIVLDRTVTIPNFTLEKYNKLRRSKLSILSMNCWGGLIYHYLGLPFLSPTINMGTGEKDFLNFVENPIKNLNEELKFQKMEWQPVFKIHYPIFTIGNTKWLMSHYTDRYFAQVKWYERTFKINWLNLIAVMTTEKPEILEEFNKLPYSKKVCFTSFKTNVECGFYVNLKTYNVNGFNTIINLLARDSVFYYDIWDMLLYGKKTPLIIK